MYESLNLLHNRSFYPTPVLNPTPAQKYYAQMFALIDGYLCNPLCTIEETASALVTPIIELHDTHHRQLVRHIRPNGQDTLQDTTWVLFSFFIDLPVQIPHSHPYQDLLVQLLAAIKRCLSFGYPGVRRHKGIPYRTLWYPYPTLSMHVRQAWAEDHYEEADHFIWMQHWTRTEFANLNAFAAKLYAEKVENMLPKAVRLLRLTLEEAAPVAMLDDLIPSAAMYIRYSGASIYECRFPEDGQGTSRTFDCGEFYHGPAIPFMKTQWHFWKASFANMAQRKDLEAETRTIARECVMLMEEIDGRTEEAQYRLRPQIGALEQLRHQRVRQRDEWAEIDMIEDSEGESELSDVQKFSMPTRLSNDASRSYWETRREQEHSARGKRLREECSDFKSLFPRPRSGSPKSQVEGKLINPKLAGDQLSVHHTQNESVTFPRAVSGPEISDFDDSVSMDLDSSCCSTFSITSDASESVEMDLACSDSEEEAV